MSAKGVTNTWTAREKLKNNFNSAICQVILGEELNAVPVLEL